MLWFRRRTDWARRKTALKVGATYRVLRTAASTVGPGFRVGERLRLRHIGYSHYDNANGFTFEAEGGSQKSFFLGDNDPIKLLRSTFRRV